LSREQDGQPRAIGRATQRFKGLRPHGNEDVFVALKQGFKWNDGGRSTSGFVGLTGDCVTRAIAIATGIAYRDVYAALHERSAVSPRLGVAQSVYGPYLKEKGWTVQKALGLPLVTELTLAGPADGIRIVGCAKEDGSRSHLFSWIHGELHDTWDPRDDNEHRATEFWVPMEGAVVCDVRSSDPARHATDLTQAEFEKIIQRLRAIDNTARNQATTDGERENALRMMQALMLRHNLSREDLTAGETEESTQYARLACPVNGARALVWEKILAHYVSEHVFPMTQNYFNRRGPRTLIFFYGPRWDVENAIQLFRELLLTIATSARLLYRGHARGSGASYAEGYVASLPKSDQLSGGGVASPTTGGNTTASDSQSPTTTSLAIMQQRKLIVREHAKDWLEIECGIRLVRSYGKSRNFRDPAAEHLGRVHGASHKLDLPSGPKRIDHKP
jgi:hypothetical protein